MLNVWEESSLPRPTLDIDLLGKGVSNHVDSVVLIVREVCGSRVVPDGIAFDPNSVQGMRIAEDAGYEGVRVRFSGLLGRARLGMQPCRGGDTVSSNSRFPVKVVSEQLGHSNIAFTLDVYSHVLPHMQDEAAAKIEDLLFGNNPSRISRS